MTPQLSNEDHSLEATTSITTPPLSPQARPWLQEQKHPRRKKLIIASVVSALLLVLVGSGSAVYAFWYQDPDKVLSDAMVNSLLAKTVTMKGSATIKQDKIKVTTAFEGSSGYGQGSSASVTASLTQGTDAPMKLGVSTVVDAKGNYFLKPSGLKELSEQYTKSLNSTDEQSIDGVSKVQIEEMQKQYKTLIDNFIAKIDNKWIKFSLDDLKKISEDAAKQYECANNVVAKLRDDSTMLQELGKLYQDHKVVVVKQELGTKDGAIGLAVGTDRQTEIAFVSGLKETKFNKQLRACYENHKTPIDEITYDNDAKSGAEEAAKYRTELWINQWTHTLEKVIVTDVDTDTSKTEYSVTIQTSFGQPVTIQTPASSKTYDELQKDIEDLTAGFMTMYQGLSQEQY